MLPRVTSLMCMVFTASVTDASLDFAAMVQCLILQLAGIIIWFECLPFDFGFNAVEI